MVSCCTHNNVRTHQQRSAKVTGKLGYQKWQVMCLWWKCLGWIYSILLSRVVVLRSTSFSSMTSSHYFLPSCQDILDYLGQFADGGDGNDTEIQHPLSCIMDQFKDEEASAATCEKLRHFLQEVNQVLGRKVEAATAPVTRMVCG